MSTAVASALQVLHRQRAVMLLAAAATSCA